MVTPAKLTARKAATVCQHLQMAGVDLPAPTQPAIHMAIIREGKKLRDKWRKELKTEIGVCILMGKR